MLYGWLAAPHPALTKLPTAISSNRLDIASSLSRVRCKDEKARRMQKFGKSQPMTRIEDAHFLTGTGQYVADAVPDRAARCIVLRGDVSHGRIVRFDTNEAARVPGVFCVVTAAELIAVGVRNSIDANLARNRDGTMGAATERPVLARDRVRFVGEPVAVVVAETVEQARDAAERIDLEIEELAAKIDAGPGGETIHPEAPDNRAFGWGMGDEAATEAAFRSAAQVVSLQVDDNRIIAYRVNGRVSLCAYNSVMGQPIQTELFSRVLMSCYDVRTVWMRVEGFYTNTTQIDAYRGAGRPEAIYVLERPMDHAARRLGIDPRELRRRKFIPADRFPYRSATGETCDVGDFHKLLSRAAECVDRDGFVARKAADAARGLLRGQGRCYYIESILGDPAEGARIQFDSDGGVSIHVGTQSNGQGHETVNAHFLSDQTGIPVDRIRVVQGDSDVIPQGGGTGGSRSVTTQTSATLATVDVMIAAFMPYLAGKVGVGESDIMFDDETFRAPGSNLTPDLIEAAEMARAEGHTDLLDHAAHATLPGRSYPNGAHVAEVVIDPEAGAVRVDRYTVVDDFGNLIDPLLAEGQVHGGVSQGLGQALCVHVVHDADGQLLTASLMDFALPRASHLPMITFTSVPVLVPSTANPMVVKGCGETGTVGSLAAVANAVQDALWDRGVRQADMPFTPLRVWELLQNESVAADE